MKIINQCMNNTWNSDGYIQVNQFYTKETTKKISTYLDEISTWAVVENKWMMWFEKTEGGRKIVSRVERFLDYHNDLREAVFSDGRLEGVLSNLLEEDVVLFKERIIFKYPDSGGYKPHQDIYSLVYEMPKREIYAVACIFIDDANENNGCLYFAPGKHKEGILNQNSNGVLYPDVYEDFTWKPALCDAGDLVIFDNYLPHYSNMNKSNSQRRVIYFPFQKRSTVGLTREEYYTRKIKIAPPEGRLEDINNFKKQNNIAYRE